MCVAGLLLEAILRGSAISYSLAKQNTHFFVPLECSRYIIVQYSRKGFSKITLPFPFLENKCDTRFIPPLGLNATFEKHCCTPDFDLKKKSWLCWAGVPD